MKYIQYAVPKRETRNASGKAKNDVYDIALSSGFKPSYRPSRRRIIRIVQQFFTMYKFIGRKTIFVQYGSVSGPFMKLLRLVSKKSFKIALIHDLLSIQGINGYGKNRDEELKKEIRLLNMFDVIIVHNKKMDELVKKFGYKGSTVIVYLFDYLHNPQTPVTRKEYSGSIVFAGNLRKSGFVSELNKIEKYSFNIYGEETGKDFSGMPNVHYKGSLPSDKIVYQMEGDYGLVWDGDSVNACTGATGEYLLYNNPHKLALYMAGGIPVITWKKAAVAEFVEKNNVGITVDSLLDLQNIDLKENYALMKNNVLRIKRDIAEGKLIKKAIKSAMDLRRGE